MRFRFDPQPGLGTIDISDVVFKISSRHELTPILMALQHLYVNHRDELDMIFDLIQEDIGLPKNPKRGCVGMNYWGILVLSSVRMGCNMDFDQLEDLASNHQKLRQMMMLSIWDNKEFSRSAIHENLYKVKSETLRKIDNMIISIGHSQSKEPLKRVRGDSFVVKKNIHYPTDTNILYDGCRKAIVLSKKVAENFDIPGFRKHNYLKTNIKSILRKITKVAQSRAKDRDERLLYLYTTMIEKAIHIKGKALTILSALNQKVESGEVVIQPKWQGYVSELHYYIAGIDYVIDLAKRRVFKGETIPNPEKVFSLFEPETELINRGKQPNPIEFGHRVLVIQDNAGFILHHDILGNGFTDEKVVTGAMKQLQSKYNGQISAASFDKGFWTPNNLKELSEFIDLVVLPKKGNHNQTDRERESAEDFGKMRKWHSGVESAIGALQSGNGLKVCRDKGVRGYARYIAMAVLGRNLHVLGNILLGEEKKKQNKNKDLLGLAIAS